MQQYRRNQQNGLPEPLGTLVILGSLALNLWNAYSNARQEKNLAAYDHRQAKIIELLEQCKIERDDQCETSFEGHD